MKKILSLLLSVALLLSLVSVPVFATDDTKDTSDSTTNEVTFPDVTGHWGESSIKRWAGVKVFNGDDFGKFNPDKQMTRAEFATMLTNMMGYTVKASNTFGDVQSGDWYADAILKLAGAGIMQGDGTNANPNAPISRQETAVLLCRAMNISAGSSANLGFADAGSVASWATDAVAALSERGMIDGVGNNMFAPKDNITRAAVAKMMDNMVSEYVVADQEITGTVDGVVIVATTGKVTLKGAKLAENLIIAPKAVGVSLTADASTTMTGVLVQANKGKLDISGKVDEMVITDTAANTTLDLGRNAVITDLETAADDLKVTGDGKITNMLVTDGSGVNVAGSVDVKELTNDGSSDVKYGTKTIRPDGKVEDNDRPTGGSSSGDHAGSTVTTVDTVAELETALANGKSKIRISDKISDEVALTFAAADVVLTNDNAKTISLDLGKKAELKSLTINALTATKITLSGDKGVSGNLTIDAPEATVNSELPVGGDVDIKAVSNETFITTGNVTGKIIMNGPGAVEVKATVTGGIEVKTDAAVILKGAVTAVAVSEKNANIALAEITAKEAVAVTGAVDTLDLGAKVNVTIADAVANVTAADGVKIAGAGTAGTVTMTGATLDLGVNATTVAVDNAKAKLNLAKDTAVGTVKTASNVTITVPTEAGTAAVGTVDVTATEGKIEVVAPAGTQVTVTPESKAEVTAKDTAGQELPVVKKHAAPTGLAFVLPTTADGAGKITGVTTAMQWTLDLAPEQGEVIWTTVVLTGGALEVTENLGETYYIRTASTTEKDVVILASDTVAVATEAPVPVTTATISEEAIIGNTLKAVANEGANGTLTYKWVNTANKNAELGTAETLLLTDEHVGATITVTITNFTDETATSDPTDPVTADKTALTERLVTVKNDADKIKVSADGKDVVTTEQWVKEDVKTTFTTVYTAVDAFAKATTPVTSAAVTAELEKLNTAFEVLDAAAENGTKGTEDPTPDSATDKLIKDLDDADKSEDQKTVTLNGDLELDEAVTVPANVTLVIAEGAKVVVPAEMTLTNNGILNMTGGQLDVAGTLVVGALDFNNTADVQGEILCNATYYIDGENAGTGGLQVSGTMTVGGKQMIGNTSLTVAEGFIVVKTVEVGEIQFNQFRLVGKATLNGELTLAAAAADTITQLGIRAGSTLTIAEDASLTAGTGEGQTLYVDGTVVVNGTLIQGEGGEGWHVSKPVEGTITLNENAKVTMGATESFVDGVAVDNHTQTEITVGAASSEDAALTAGDYVCEACTGACIFTKAAAEGN